MSAPSLQPASGVSARRHLMSVAVEDYFQVIALDKIIPTSQWYRFERRIERNTRRALDLLDEFGVKATFFALGWVADEMPEVLREIAERGHEVASKGYLHRRIQQMTPGEFREDAARSREAIERATGVRVRGYRIARGHFGPEDLWALDQLAELDFAYDSSFYPRLRSIAAEPWRRFAHEHASGGRRIWELPLSTWEAAGWLVPVAGGAYLRQLPNAFVQHAVESWHRHQAAPFVMYFHVWELDPDLPRITAASRLSRVRLYRNLERMPALLRSYLARYPFGPIAGYLGLAPEPAAPAATAAAPAGGMRAVAAAPAQPVTVVVPCFNEERVLPYLRNTLRRVEDELAGDWALRFVFVDDGSSDRTWEVLRETFGDLPNCRFLRHDGNRGVAAAIMTGIRAADTEVVCSIDCDCTYDPHQLRELIPMLGSDVALVTASPYHPSGRVRNVPGWRLFLSKGLSGLYRRAFRQRLHTYTSCFRVYRRSAVADLPIREAGFLGVTEMLGLLDARGARIVEAPAVLEVRMLGRSKMKLAKTILGHLRLLVRFGAARWIPGRRAEAPEAGAAAWKDAR